MQPSPFNILTQNVKNPLGIIALFISLIYGLACVVLGVSIDKLSSTCERLPLIWFIISFPVLILFTFTFLVIRYHHKLYAPGDYRDEKNFITMNIGHNVSHELTEVQNKLESLSGEEKAGPLANSLNEISHEIEKIKEKSSKILINKLWRLNHWGSRCAKIVGDRIVFTGTSAPEGEDGSHIDLNNFLEIGKSYKVTCWAKSSSGTDGVFRLWCHDQTGAIPTGSVAATLFRTPAQEGEEIGLTFTAEYNKNIRIHLQYKPGIGEIEISDVKISPVN